MKQRLSYRVRMALFLVSLSLTAFGSWLMLTSMAAFLSSLEIYSTDMESSIGTVRNGPGTEQSGKGMILLPFGTLKSL
jgi:hypothetical protein